MMIMLILLILKVDLLLQSIEDCVINVACLFHLEFFALMTMQFGRIPKHRMFSFNSILQQPKDQFENNDFG